MAKSKKEVLSAIIDGITACYRITFCTCGYRVPGEGGCDHCRIRKALVTASDYVADCNDEEGFDYLLRKDGE